MNNLHLHSTLYQIAHIVITRNKKYKYILIKYEQRYPEEYKSEVEFDLIQDTVNYLCEKRGYVNNMNIMMIATTEVFRVLDELKKQRKRFWS